MERERGLPPFPESGFAQPRLSSVPRVSLLVSDFHMNNYSSMSRIFPTRERVSLKYRSLMCTHTLLVVCSERLCAKHSEEPEVESHYSVLSPQWVKTMLHVGNTSSHDQNIFIYF